MVTYGTKRKTIKYDDSSYQQYKRYRQHPIAYPLVNSWLQRERFDHSLLLEPNVGPDYFQYPPEHADIARRLYRMMHPDLRRTGEPELKFPSQEDVIANDPTESPQSSQIEEVFRRVWPDAEVIGTYGSLAFMVMWTLDHDALYDSAAGREAFRTLLDLDTALIDAGALPHYFAYLIGRKPAASPRGLALRVAGRIARLVGG